MKKYLFLIALLSGVWLGTAGETQGQQDSNLVWIKENQRFGNATRMDLARFKRRLHTYSKSVESIIFYLNLLFNKRNFMYINLAILFLE